MQRKVEDKELNWYIDNNLVHSIHTSSRRSFRGCRRRWNWISREGYYPLVTAKPLEFGVAFHAALEKWYDPITWGDKATASTLAIATFQQTVDKQFNEYWKLVQEGKVTGDMDAAKTDYRERRELGVGMLKHYTKNVSPKEDFNFTPVKVEIAFEVPIKDEFGNTLWCKCNWCWKRYVKFVKENEQDGTCLCKGFNHGMVEQCGTSGMWEGLPVAYGGRIDMLARDQLGRLWVYDWKTAARMSTGEPGAPDDYLWLDDQITSYCWALWSIGLPVAGFVYAEIKKAVPEAPEPLQRPYKGRLFSTNKQLATTYELYSKTVEENDPSGFYGGAYNNFLEYLQSNEATAFTKRHEITRNETELRNAGLDIFNEAADMVDPNLRIYPSAGRFSCSFCAFQEPCLAMNRGDDYQYTLNTLYEKRDRHYWEAKPSTDSKGGQ